MSIVSGEAEGFADVDGDGEAEVVGICIPGMFISIFWGATSVDLEGAREEGMFMPVIFISLLFRLDFL